MSQRFLTYLRSRHNFVFLLIMLLLYGCYLCIFLILHHSGVSCHKFGDLEHLKLLQIISRHGARNPIWFYPNDPHKNHDFIEGAGQLNNFGKLQQYKFGQFLKQQYRSFLTSNPNEVYARSSAMDRTIESAMATLAGLYPPEGSWIWNRNLNWQPIPVYSIPAKDDQLLYFNDCPGFLREYTKLMKSEMAQNYYAEIQEFFKFLSVKTGNNVTDLFEVLKIYSIIQIESQHGLCLPTWATENVIEKLRMYTALFFRLLFGNSVLQRLNGGSLIADIIKNIQDKLNGSIEERKLFFYSTHDVIVAALMNALNVYNNMPPPFSAAIIIEFHSVENQNFLRILYSNSTTPENFQQHVHLLQVPGCSSDCPLETFLNLTKNVVPINLKQECE